MDIDESTISVDFIDLKYRLLENLRQKGAWYYTWRIGLVVGVFYFAVTSFITPSEPSSTSSAQRNKAQAEAKAYIDADQLWHQTSSTNRDLRKMMTAAQSQFYWDSFHWMMEYGEATKRHSFSKKTIKLAFIMSDLPEDPKAKRCRSFRELLVISGKANIREGIACRQAPANWCKQVKSEKMECRMPKKEGGMDAVLSDGLDTHNFNIRLKRGLSNLPGF